VGWRSRLFLGIRARVFLGIRTRRHDGSVTRASAWAARGSSGCACGRGDAGVTLIELVIAFSVLMIILVPVGMLLTNVLGQSATAGEKLTALSLAEHCLEKLNNTGPTLTQGVPETNVAILENSRCFSTSLHTAPVTESTMSYDVHAEFTWETAQGNHPDLCTSSDTATLIEAQVWTTWGRTQKVTDTTLLDYPPPGLPDDGFLAIVVNGTPAGSPPADASGRAWSTRVQSVPVRISRTGFSVTAHPNSYGCVFEEVPAPDSYTVTASNPTIGGKPASPAWTSANETTTASETVTAQLATVTHATLRFDEGSVVDLHYPSTTATEGPVICPGAGEVQCVVFGQAPSSSATPAKAPEAEISVLDTASESWSVAPVTGATRLAALACAGTNRCIAVGYGGSAGAYTGASVSSGTSGAPSFTTDTVPPGVSVLSGITCPSATRCYAWGWDGSSAVILTGAVTSSSVTWGTSADLLSTVPSRVTSLACWSRTRCYALGTRKTATTPVILSLASTSHKWTTDTLPSTSTYAPLTLAQLACPAATRCYAVGTRKTAHADVVSLSTKTEHTWTNDMWKTTSTTTTVTALKKLDCPSATVCYAIGTRGSSSSAAGAIASRTSGNIWEADTPKTAKSIAAITCPSASSCLAMGTSSSGSPELLWRTTTSTFTSEALPATVTGLSAITCPSSARCFAIGTASSAGSAHAAVLSGTTTWRVDTLPATPTAVSFSGLACGGTACAAAGATETAAAYLDGTPGGSTWTGATPSGPKGMYVGGVPIAVTNPGLATRPLEVAVPTGTAAVSQTPALFPFSSGYAVAATECNPLPASATVDSSPGAISTATLPMGLLSLRVVNAYGLPDTGATVTASPTCTKLAAPKGASNPASFTLEPTGPLGMSQEVVPYGTYTLTVTHGTHTSSKTVSVSPSSVSATGGAAAPAVPLVVTVT
jgi:Tfp pilus assembly protein PilV